MKFRHSHCTQCHVATICTRRPARTSYEAPDVASVLPHARGTSRRTAIDFYAPSVLLYLCTLSCSSERDAVITAAPLRATMTDYDFSWCRQQTATSGSPKQNSTIFGAASRGEVLTRSLRAIAGSQSARRMRPLLTRCGLLCWDLSVLGSTSLARARGASATCTISAAACSRMGGRRLNSEAGFRG